MTQWTDKIASPSVPRGREAKKTPQEKRLAAAVDFAYTLNHAIVCTLTDPITDVPIGVAVQKMLGNRGAPAAPHASWKHFTPKHVMGHVKETFTDKKALLQWTAGEFGGDFGAVPVVVALRQLAPGSIDAIRNIFQPLATPLFKQTTARAARKEFKAQGLDVDSPECAARAKELFDKEMEHLPNAVLWTVASPTINILTQKFLLPRSLRNTEPTSHIVAGKVIGSTVTSGLTVGLRGLNPDKAQQWDNKVSEKIALPVVNIAAGMFGVDKAQLHAELKQMQEKKAHSHGASPAADHSAWKTRLLQEAGAPSPSGASR